MIFSKCLKLKYYLIKQMSQKDILILYLGEALQFAQNALDEDNANKIEKSTSFLAKAILSLSKARLFSDPNYQRLVSNLVNTFQQRIQDLNGKHLQNSVVMSNTITSQCVARETEVVGCQLRTSCPMLNNIAGLEKAKHVLLEAIFLPKKFPHLYSTFEIFNKILLYGVSHQPYREYNLFILMFLQT